MRKLLLIAMLLFPLAALAGGGFDPEQQQMVQQVVDDGALAPEVMAAVVLGVLGVAGVVVGAILNRRKR